MDFESLPFTEPIPVCRLFTVGSKFVLTWGPVSCHPRISCGPPTSHLLTENLRGLRASPTPSQGWTMEVVCVCLCTMYLGSGGMCPVLLTGRPLPPPRNRVFGSSTDTSQPHCFPLPTFNRPRVPMRRPLPDRSDRPPPVDVSGPVRTDDQSRVATGPLSGTRSVRPHPPR